MSNLNENFKKEEKFEVDLEKKRPCKYISTITMIQELNERIKSREIQVKESSYNLGNLIGFKVKGKQTDFGFNEMVWGDETNFTLDESDNEILRKYFVINQK